MISNIFLSERNVVIITIKPDYDEEYIAKYVMKNLLTIANKNILPISIMVLGLPSIANVVIKNASLKIMNNLTKKQAQLTELIESSKK